MTEVETVTLDNLACGAANELFMHAHKKVMDSISDLNAPWKAKRRITLTIDFTVDEAREKGFAQIGCAVKVPATKPVEAMVYVAKHKGQTVMVEPLRQQDMFDASPGRPEGVVEGGAR